MGQDNKSPHKRTHLPTYVNDISDHEWTFCIKKKRDSIHITWLSVTTDEFEINYIFNELDIISELIITYKFHLLKSYC